MAATTGLTLLVLLLYCGQGADLPPIDVTSGTASGLSWPGGNGAPGAQNVLYRRRVRIPPRQAPLGSGHCIPTPGSRKTTVDAPVLRDEPEERGPARPPAQCPGDERPWRSAQGLGGSPEKVAASACPQVTGEAQPAPDASIHESDQLSVPEGFHKLADLSPISLETEDKILNEPSLDASYQTSGPEDYRDSQTSGTADSLHSNGKKHPKTDQQLKQSVLDMILQNIGKSSDQGIAS
ncbi:uncharacterized protein LOC132657243 [Ovis aries]|uniref:uncharacterized protein LOC132657243 n=1 Tax=Ovis aries TaxID=9940 RepID=UPI0029526A98|nr:uncharacterized protein LOC132657243 [Ovis aries]